MKNTIVYPAPAKLNLMLHIIGRRPNGYHELQSIIQFLDFGDSLTFSPRADNNIVLQTPIANVANEDNLIIKAANLLQQHYHVELGVDITITKRIPQGAGLGGGSSDAATTLHVLNRLWQLNLSHDMLATLGVQLGADIPMFILGHAALIEGIGEIITPLESLVEPWYIVLVPPTLVPTKEIYADPELTRDTLRRTISALPLDARNDFEHLVQKRYPLVKEALLWLNARIPARLTGSGAAIFGTVDDEASAEKILAEVPATFGAFIAKGMNKSPLLTLLNQLD
jgi:4-diphosphocytidyl-2-C-methyl-D-erythritol kinase